MAARHLFSDEFEVRVKKDVWRMVKSSGAYTWNCAPGNHEITGASEQSYENYMDCLANMRRNGYFGPSPTPVERD